MITPADRLKIDGLAECDYRVYPAIAAIADKTCSIMEMRDERPSSRVKDLADIVVYFLTEDLDGDALHDRILLESRLRKMQPNLPFSIPNAWRDSYGPTYRKSAQQSHMPEEYLDIEAAEAYVAGCLDVLLDDESCGLIWNAATQSWTRTSQN